MAMTDPTYEYALDIFGQQPDLHNLYTQISLIYSLPSRSPSPSPSLSRPSTPATHAQPHLSPNENENENTADPLVSTLTRQLTSALERLTASIPWIAGQVVLQTPPEKKKKYKIVPLDRTPRLTIKDLRPRYTRRRRGSETPTAEHPGHDADAEDLNAKKLTMKALRGANFPMSMLDENVLAPRNTLMAPGDVCPVFMVQGTIVPYTSGFQGGAREGSGNLEVKVEVEGEGDGDGEGEGRDGVILTFVGLHNVMDMTGLGWILGLLDRLARGGEMTSAEIELANIDRTRLFVQPVAELAEKPLGEVKEDSAVHAKAEVQAKTSGDTLESSLRWAYILFPTSSLAEMKALSLSHNNPTPTPSHAQASDTDTQSPLPLKFVSTDDVLSAFIFQSIIRARLPRLIPPPTPHSKDQTTHPPTPTVTATFARAIDPRRFLLDIDIDIDPSYPGVVQCMTYTTYPLLSIPSLPLAKIAADLRAELTAPSRSTASPTTTSTSTSSDIAHRTRLLANQISCSLSLSSSSSSSSSSPPASVSVTSTLDLTRDVMLSSWANQSALWTSEFGIGLGPPESVRRPAFVGVESLCYVMPRARGGEGQGQGGKGGQGEGEAVVAVCLRDEDMQRMRDDEQVKKWCFWVG